MNINPNVVATAAVVTVIGVATVRQFKTARYRHADDLAEIRRQGALDIQAIRNAKPCIEDRINRGEIQDLGELALAFNEEIAFQKIAIRES